MSTTTASSIQAGREARRARAKARAATFGPEVEVKISDVRVGDFLVVVPSQEGVQGCRAASIVTGVGHDWDTWYVRGYGRSRTFVPSTTLRFGVNADPQLVDVGLNVPQSFRCTIKRAQ